MVGTEHPLVRLAELAAELGTDVDTLARRLGPDAVLLDRVGFRCVEAPAAARLLDEHRAAVAREKRRDSARRQRLAEVSRRAQATLRGGIPTSADGDSFAAMIAIDGTPPRIKAAEARLDAWLAGKSTGARISPKGT